MGRLLAIEFQKIRYSRAAKVISIIYFILIAFIALMASIEFDIGDIHFRLADQGIFNFPFIWHFNTYIAAILKFFLAVVIVSMMSNEYSYRTLKQNLIDGLSKKEFVLSKFVIVLLFSAISTLFIFVVSLLLGLSFSDYNEMGIVFSNMEFILAYFIKLVGFFSFCLFVGVLVKRSAFALGFLFVWFIAEKILWGILEYRLLREQADSVMQFFPLEAMSNLIVEPFTRLGAIQSAANQLGEVLTKSYDVTIFNILIVLVWTAIFIYGSYAILKKRDL
ncbi:ABC transporter permease [Aequorivita echinoideorum]|uniref:ABC transporter permease n=1 Tax=Aequorivita echinoideorum TaxID=1549647 RepID=A0ABS5S755_9FLAO|nr:ABC transporter permease [Aequorivita echinoideorum]MBT0609047.1 ABC transporter permease [Aequorivita echinoideorum]